MSDLFLMALPHTEKETKSRIDNIGRMVDEAEKWQKSIVKDVDRIKALAAEMTEYGLVKAAKQLLACLE